MEGRKKSSKELLEEKQMKRYFRSIKRAKGKNRKENRKIEVEIQEVSKKENVVENSGVKSEKEKTKTSKKSTQILSENDTNKNAQNKPSSNVECKPSEPQIRSQPTPQKSSPQSNKTEVTKVVEKETNAKQEDLNEDTSDDLFDWEIVPNFKEQCDKEENDLNFVRNTENSFEMVNNENIDDADDENKLWVEEMNKVNEKISYEMRQKMNENDNKLCEVSINKDPIIQSKDNINDDMNEKLAKQCISNDQTKSTEDSEDNLFPSNSVIHTVQEEVEKTNAKCKTGSSIKEQTIEFSPIVYWRDPLPEITPLSQEISINKTKPDIPNEVKIKDISIENKESKKSFLNEVKTLPEIPPLSQEISINKTKPEIQNEVKIKDISIENKESKKSFLNEVKTLPEIPPLSQEISINKTKPEIQNEVKIKDISIENKESKKSSLNEVKQNIKKVIKKDDAFNQFSFDNVWLDKYKYDDAETKYYQKLAKQVECEVKPNGVTKSQNNAKHTYELSNTSGNENEHTNTRKFRQELNEIKTIAAIEVPDEKKKNTEVKNNKSEENSSLEDRLKMLEAENTEFKQSLSHLSSCVKKLEERVRNLEEGSLSSSMTDEGVDMTGEPRCPFFEDCLCNSDSEDTKPNGDNISLNDGSEFEEFVATTTIDNCETCRDTLWKDDWEDNTGRDLAAELRENCRK